MRRKINNHRGVEQETNTVSFAASRVLPRLIMSVHSDTICAIAYLARLQVEEEELPALTKRFNAVLELFQQMEDVDTAGVSPMANPLDATQPLREDIVTQSNQREALQAVAPKVADGLYLVPRVIE